MNITKESIKKSIDVAMGREKADLVIKNCKIVDVCGGNIIEGNIAISGGIIVGIGDYEGEREYDAEWRYASPGLIDSHIHIESSYCSPEEFAAMALSHGTTTIIADPHEIVNVCGLSGFDYMKKASDKTKLTVKLMLPSCVPATSFEDAGAIVTATDMQAYIGLKDVPGLGEFMDYMSVINAEDMALDKLILARNMDKVIDGHSPGLRGKELNAYSVAGISTDHECSTPDEMIDRLQRGMYVQLRQGSACHNLKELIPAINSINFRRCVLCSDDRQPKSIFEEGYMEEHLRILVSEGIDPTIAIAMGSINAAECYKLSDRGMIAPGKRGDIVLFQDLKDFVVADVFVEGEHIASNGNCLLEFEKEDITPVRGSVHLKNFNIDKLKLRLKSNMVYAIEMVPGGVLSKKALVEIKLSEDGDFVFEKNKDVIKCAVIERHKDTEKIGLGFIKGYGMEYGAIAVSVSHDSHNIICIGVSNEEMETAINVLHQQEGGFVIVKDNKVLGSLALPIAGIMSNEKGEVVAEKLHSLHELALKELKVSDKVEPIMTLTFMSLIVIPELKLTARGLFDVMEYKFIDIEKP
ncbi:MAG: adenine deaminase [Filifactoraceae bacterium]